MQTAAQEMYLNKRGSNRLNFHLNQKLPDQRVRKQGKKSDRTFNATSQYLTIFDNLCYKHISVSTIKILRLPRLPLKILWSSNKNDFLMTHLFPSTAVSLVHDRPRPEWLSCAAEPAGKLPLVLQRHWEANCTNSVIVCSLSLTLEEHCLHCFSSRQSPAALARPGSSGLSFRSNHFRLWEQTHTQAKFNK